MGFYVVKRLISIIPFALFAVLIVFLIFESSWQPDLSTFRNNASGYNADGETLAKIKCEQRSRLKLDWPLFYISISSKALPKELNSICEEQERKLIKKLCLHNGNTQGAQFFVRQLAAVLKDNFDPKLEKIYSIYSVSSIWKVVSSHPELSAYFQSYTENSSLFTVFVPRLEFHLFKNRFHHWLTNVLQLNFGRSTLDNQLVKTKVNSSIIKTLSFTIPAVIIIFLLSILLGYFLSSKGGMVNSTISNLLYFIDSIPLVWLSIVILLLASFLGLGYSTLDFGNDSLWSKVTRYSLPILTLVLASIPYVTKQVQQSINETAAKPYILTARAKGLSKNRVFFKHVLPNASLPIVTLFFSYLALAFGGAFVVEWVYSINGIGKLMTDAVLANDLPVISAIILYLIFIKMSVTLLSDITNYLINPSIKF